MKGLLASIFVIGLFAIGSISSAQTPPSVTGVCKMGGYNFMYPGNILTMADYDRFVDRIANETYSLNATSVDELKKKCYGIARYYSIARRHVLNTELSLHVNGKLVLIQAGKFQGSIEPMH